MPPVGKGSGSMRPAALLHGGHPGTLSPLGRRKRKEQEGRAAAAASGMDLAAPSSFNDAGPDPAAGAHISAPKRPKRVRFSSAGAAAGEPGDGGSTGPWAVPGVGAAPSWHASGTGPGQARGGGGSTTAELVAFKERPGSGTAPCLTLEDLQLEAEARGLGGRVALVPDMVSREELGGAITLGQIDRKVVAAACGPLLVALDQHAADERVQLEALQARLAEERTAHLSGPPPAKAATKGYDGGVLLQQLILRRPQPLDLGAVEHQALSSHAALVEQWGWLVAAQKPGAAAANGQARPLQTSAGGATALTAVPLLCGVPLGGLDLKLWLHQLAECDGDAGGAGPPGVLRVLRSKACRGAVMFGDALTPDRCSELMHRLHQTRLPFCCAHGRPTTAPLVDLGALEAVLRQRAARQVDSGPGPVGGWESVGGGRLSVTRLARLVLEPGLAG